MNLVLVVTAMAAPGAQRAPGDAGRQARALAGNRERSPWLVANSICLVLTVALGLSLGLSHSLAAQEQAPNRREIALTASNYRFSPNRIEVQQDDLVKLIVQSQDVAYSLTIDEYRVSRRVPAGGSTTLEFRADRPGTFAFYSNLTNDARHAQMRGELVVRGR